VGGDYYDFLALPDGKLGIALGDVSGKGIAAALMMASLEASLRAEASRADSGLAAMIGRVNQMLFDASSEDRYATLFYALYDPATRLLTYVNAGHNAPMLFRQLGTVERLDEGGGPVVGLLPECVYEQSEVTLGPGDMLLMYTDGITEALDPNLEEWGEKRLIAAASELRPRSSDEVVAGIVRAADIHAAGAPQSDDMTLVVLRLIEH
jgi:sigma-B regulation protein RsbU (phosphoserine phosphatase)